MRNKSRMIEAFRLIWIVCLAVDALPAKQIYGLTDVQDSGDGDSQQNVPEPMMDFFNCDLDQSCLEAYGWPAECPHTEYTVRAVIGNGEEDCIANYTKKCNFQHTKIAVIKFVVSLLQSPGMEAVC